MFGADFIAVERLTTMEYLNVRTMERSKGMQPSDLVPQSATQQIETAQVQGYTMSQEPGISVVENVILETKNYEKFTLDPTNRPTDMDRVYKLCEAIAEKNLLHLFPIVVTPQFVVIDGQHRLKAAVLLDTPIFYLMSRQMRMEDAASVVSNTAGWSMTDWLHHWCERGNPEYLMLRDFWSAHRWLPLSIAARLCQNQQRNAATFNKGVYVADSIPFATRVCSMAKDFKTWFTAWNSATFVGALIQLAANESYSHKHMMGKMQYQSTKLVRCPNVDMYLALITTIYNFKTRPEHEVVFRGKSRTNRNQVK